ncbi:glycosyltransferase family 9 protein [Deferribacterales bacterium RsTz2092]|nr:ADP-heptose--LPS heptosyltransferase II [Deferribacterales bacterium]
MNELSSAKRILVFNPSFIGDAILTTPLIKAIRKLAPNAQIDLCIRPESAPLLKKISLFNVLTYDKYGTDKGLNGFIRLATRLKAAEYDIAFVLHKSFRSTLLMKLAKIPLLIGYKQAALSFLLDKRTNRDMSLHEVERCLSLLVLMMKNYTLSDAKTLGGLPLTHLDERYYNNLKDYYKVICGGKRVVGLCPGSTWNTKMWCADSFVQLAQKLHTIGFAVAIIGGPSDVFATDTVRTKLDFEYFDFANKVPFELIPAVIKSLDVLVCNDSAPLHIAVSQSVPVVAIFGATVPSLGFAPYGSSRYVIVEDTTLDCRPCGPHGSKSCPQKHFKCMNNISPEKVVNAMLYLLE